MGVPFLVTTLVVVVTPGIGVLYTVSAGLTRGVRGGLIAAVGCTLGIVPHAVAAILGLAALLHASAVAFEVLKYLGVTYLVYLAWRTLQESGSLDVASADHPSGPLQVIGRAIAVNLLNPKLSLFFFAFLPQFVSQHDPRPLATMGGLSALFMAATFAVFALYGMLAGQARRSLLSRPRVMNWMRRSFAVAFVALAAKLAVAER